jgi:hypothetical protein
MGSVYQQLSRKVLPVYNSILFKKDCVCVCVCVCVCMCVCVCYKEQPMDNLQQKKITISSVLSVLNLVNET